MQNEIEKPEHPMTGLQDGIFHHRYVLWVLYTLWFSLLPVDLDNGTVACRKGNVIEDCSSTKRNIPWSFLVLLA